MPGALIEPLFVTDPYGGREAASPAGQGVIAAGLAKAVEQYFAPPAPSAANTEAAKSTRHGGGRRPST